MKNEVAIAEGKESHRDGLEAELSCHTSILGGSSRWTIQIVPNAITSGICGSVKDIQYLKKSWRKERLCLRQQRKLSEIW